MLDTVKKQQQNWNQRVDEMSTNRVTKKREIFQGDALEEDPGGDGAVTSINVY